jgi:hypothetical protein
MLSKYNLQASHVIYFEQNKEACDSAESVDIRTYFYDHTAEYMKALKLCLDNNLQASRGDGT